MDVNLLKPFPVADNNNYDLVCLKEDKVFGLITLYVKPNSIHHTKDNKGAKEI